jgi:hypothetical protein
VHWWGWIPLCKIQDFHVKSFTINALTENIKVPYRGIGGDFLFIYSSCEFGLAERIRAMGCNRHGMIVRQSGDIFCKSGGDL